MILVAGLAVGIAGFRDKMGRDPGINWFEAGDIAGFVLMWASSLLILFRLRRPRPSIRRVVRQPGAVACIAAVAFCAAYDVEILARKVYDRREEEARSVGGWIWYVLESPASQFAYVVPICWMLLILGRRWRPERGWIDRSGRVVGWGWIIWVIAYPYLP